jgi:UDP-glucuronate 4-epimerase
VSPYGQTKLGAEQLCRIYAAAHGLDTRVLRYFTVFGPRQRPDMAFTRFLSAALDGAPLAVFGDGHQTRDYTYVADAVAATLAAAELDADAAGLPFDIGGGAPATVMEVIEVIRSLTGSRLDVRHLAAEPGEPRDTLADTSRARELLGFEPSRTLEDGLALQLAWLKEDRAQAMASPALS